MQTYANERVAGRVRELIFSHSLQKSKARERKRIREMLGEKTTSERGERRREITIVQAPSVTTAFFYSPHQFH